MQSIVCKKPLNLPSLHPIPLQQISLRRSFCRLLATGVLLACVSANSGAQSPESFLTPEFNANWGLGVINAQDAYAMGYTGAGIKLGIADDPFQFTHPEFAGRVYFPGVFPLFPVPGFDLPPLLPSHGTHVMGLAAAARNNEGMMGVAFDASLAGIIAVGADGYSPPGDWAGELLDAGASVMNGSFGPNPVPPLKLPDTSPGAKPDDRVPNPTHEFVSYQLLFIDGVVDFANAIERLSAADVVMVFAAGNAYIDQPLASAFVAGAGMIPLITPDNTRAQVLYRFFADGNPNDPKTWEFLPIEDTEMLDGSSYAGALITVVALDKNNQIAEFSNRCGQAAAWCVAAPGVDLLSSVPMSTYKEFSGTSMAAPLVAGSAAVLRQAFPYMNARQIIEVLLTTATDLGDRDIYGHGLLNLGRAVKGPIEFGADPIFAEIFQVDTQGHHSIWSNDIGGSGGLTKSGAGILRLTGNNSYEGPTTVLGGTLEVNGVIAESDLTIEVGGTLAGTGVVADTLIRGALSPGNSIGTLTVDGNFMQTSGSVFILEIENRTEHDALIVKGSALIEEGARLSVVTADVLSIGTPYRFLTVEDTLTGTYSLDKAGYLFLDERILRLSDSTQGLAFEVTRNGVPMAFYAQTSNQVAVAQAIDSQQQPNEPFDSLVMATDASVLPIGYQDLSGEIYASQQAVFINSTGLVSQRINWRLQDQASTAVPGRQIGQAPINDKTQAWVDVYGNWQGFNASANAAAVSADGTSILFGIDHSLSDGFRLGGAFGFTQIDTTVVNSRASAQAHHLALYGSGAVSLVALTGGVVQSWYDAQVNRTLTRALANDPGTRLSTDQSGYSTQLFADISLPLPLTLTPRQQLQPFVQLSQTWLSMGAFTEKGGAAALQGQKSRAAAGFGTLGLRWKSAWSVQDKNAFVSAMVGWQRGWGDLSPATTLAFSSGDPFTVSSAPMAKNAVALELGATLEISDNSRFSMTYGGTFGSGTSNQTVQLQVQWRF